MNSLSHLLCPACGATNRIPVARLGDGPRCGSCGALLLGGQPLDLDPAGLERHVRVDGLPVLADFWAPWCGPCRGMAPVFAQAARQYATQLRFVKVNTEEYPAVVAAHGIRGIPTLILFKGGREADRVSGALSGAQLSAWLARHL